MINFQKNLILALLLALLLVSGCKSKKGSDKSLEEMRVGTEGITMNFIQNAPPDKIHVEKDAPEELNSFEVVMEMRNKGAYPQPDEGAAPLGRVYLSGYDPNIISFKESNVQEFNDKSLEGKSSINPNGGLDIASFKGTVNVENINVDKYEPTLLASACYFYQTVAGPSVCIDPNPYSVTNERKVCQVQDITLSSQGAPIAVTRIDEEAFARKTQFKITVKNVGGGEALKFESIESNKCSPSGEKILREDIDKVYLKEVKAGSKSLKCGPFTNSADGSVRREEGEVRLINGEGYIICELLLEEYGDQVKTAFVTPMTIKLQYGYRNSIEKKIQIKREVSTTT
ncbi:hypothetical protein HYX08_00015 [Candidatus Woesearchaeota archaeon]|nr:hypothetical protein [Candidatus Woesearchaeota archaeon]